MGLIRAQSNDRLILRVLGPFLKGVSEGTHERGEPSRIAPCKQDVSLLYAAYLWNALPSLEVEAWVASRARLRPRVQTRSA